MKRRSLACILLIAVFIVPSFLVAADKVTQETERGKALFKTQCQVCHINKLEGDQPSAYTRQFHPADFSDPDAWKDLDKREDPKRGEKRKGSHAGAKTAEAGRN